MAENQPVLSKGPQKVCPCGIEFMKKCQAAASLRSQKRYIGNPETPLSKEGAEAMIEEHETKYKEICDEQQDFKDAVNEVRGLIKAEFD